MKYLVLVSHGQFADGLKDALSMLAGERDDVLSAGLKNGKVLMNSLKNFHMLLRVFIKMMKSFY